MTEIVIHKCTLRLVRCGGWSWGADPRRLLEDVLGVVPELIATKLAELIPADGVDEIRERIEVRLQVKRSDLKLTTDGEGAKKVREALARSLDKAILEAAAQYKPPDGPSDAEEPRVEPLTVLSEAASTDIAQILLSGILRWRERGLLDWALRVCSREELARWCQLLLEVLPHGSNGAGASLELEGGPTMSERPTLGEGSSELLRSWICAVAEASAEGEFNVDIFDLAETASYPQAVEQDVARPGRAARSAATDTEPTQPMEAFDAPRKVGGSRQRVSPASSVDLNPTVDLDIRVASTLPWLMLSPLSRLGLIDAAMVAMEFADCRHDASYWATALAYKVLDPPARGWSRSRAAENSAAAFAGLTEPVSHKGLAQFARQLDGFTGMFDAAVSDSTLSGRNVDSPLLLWSTPECSAGGLLLLDPEGLFSAVWTTGLEELLPALEIADNPLLVLPREVTDPGLFSALTRAGFRFVTDTPPGRHDVWHRVPGADGDRWWQNRTGSISVPCRQIMRQFEDTVAMTRGLVDQLFKNRPAVALDTDNRLERSVSLAVANALGIIAWELWRDSEAVDPSLTLERFADLDGVVRFRRESVQVRLPLGKRYRDLYEHDLLQDVANVPWLGGRRVEFGGG